MSKWEKGICNEKSGFLFSHPCDRIQRNLCFRCEKPICVDHSHTDPVGGNRICTTCFKKSGRQSRELDDQNRSPYHFGHNPYFYSSHYGGFWGATGSSSSHHHSNLQDDHDEHDFTEADGISFHQQGDQEFESDMTES